MKSKSLFAMTFTAMSMAIPAYADDANLGATTSHEGPPASTGFEVAVGAGYAQGFGNVASGTSLTDIQTAGGAIEIDAGYRLIPSLMLGIYGTGSIFAVPSSAPTDTNAYGMSAGVQANWHFIPDGTFDPWVGLGTGWRGNWTTANSQTTSRHGWEIARLQAGVDYRMTENVAISPVVGVDLSMFFTEKLAGQDGWHNIQSPEANTFLYAALMGRFDIQTR